MEGLFKLVSIKASLNWGLSEKFKESFPDIQPILRPVVKLSEIQDIHWFIGFVEGDSRRRWLEVGLRPSGCFIVVVQEAKSKGKHNISLRFRITRAPALPRSHPITTTGGDGVKFYLLTLTTTSSSMNKTCFARQAAAGQHNRDLVLLESLIKYLGCGRCYLSRNEATFIISTFADLSEKIIPLPLRGILY